MTLLSKTFNTENSDIFGALASGLCLLHCMATPFIFIAQTEVSHHHNAPIWWQSIDLIFIGISFLAVLWSSKNTSKTWVKYSFWVSWILLSIIILNEKLAIFYIPGALIYIPALALVALHIYNKKYCQCNDESCCTD